MSPSEDPERFLAIYLNDHLAGAMLGVELARRLRSSNKGDPEMGAALGEICVEIEADRATLERVMGRLEIPRGRLKPAAAWVAEKLGRLKLNGRLRGYSPLSRVLELESLHLGIAGKTALEDARAQRRRGPRGVRFRRAGRARGESAQPRRAASSPRRGSLFSRPPRGYP